MADAEHLNYPWGQALPEADASIELVPGLHWLRLPLPFALNHINVWLLADELDGRQGWTLVDTGVGNAASRAHWEGIIGRVLAGRPIVRVLCTHLHPDHIGLAAWHVQRWSTAEQPTRLWISATDYAVAQMLVQRPSGVGGASAAAHFRRHGLVHPASLAKVEARGNYYASLVPALPECYRRVMGGDVLPIGGQTWRCIAGYGHAPEHIALHDEARGLLISGDMLLPTISTNVSVIDTEPEGNPLALFLASLRALQSLPAETLVLPSHGRPFRGLHARVEHLLAHHNERLALVAASCASAPHSAADLLPLLFRRALDLHQTTFAMGEAIAHLHALWHGGQLRRHLDAEGVWRFALA